MQFKPTDKVQVNDSISSFYAGSIGTVIKTEEIASKQCCSIIFSDGKVLNFFEYEIGIVLEQFNG